MIFSALLTVALSGLIAFGNPLEKRSTCTVTSAQDASVDDVPAIEAAIQSCGDGGVIVIPAGYTYQIRSTLDFTGCSNCEVQIEGTLKLSDNTTFWNGVKAAILLTDITGATIHSKTSSGVVDGNGVPFWIEFAANSSFARPTLMYITGGSNIVVENLYFKNAPNVFHSVTGGATNVVYTGLRLDAEVEDDATPKNTDGFDVSGSYVTISNVTVSNQDDCVAFKANANYVTVTDITCSGSHGLSVGSLGESNNDVVQNIYVNGATMINSTKATGIKLYDGSSGHGVATVKNVTFSNIVVQSSDYAAQIQVCYDSSSTCVPSSHIIEDVYWTGISGTTSSEYDPVVANLDCPADGTCDIYLSDFTVKAPSGGAELYSNMKAFARKIKESLQSNPPASPVAHASSSNASISAVNVYRFRKQKGVNLDQPYCFAKAPGQSDLDVARGSNAKETLERHWDTWITEDDWHWISELGINTVRIPIGYYHLCGADRSVLSGTAFQDFESVFSGAWSRITKAIETANRYGLGVLIDLHAAPGKQNNDAHSGTSEPPTFFSDRRSRDHTTHVLCNLVKLLENHANSHQPALANIVGIELLNEPAPSSDPDLQGWYTWTIKAIREINPTIPVYIGECWRTDQYADYVERNASLCPLVLDHHLYRCFTASDTSTPVQEHTHALQSPSANIPQMFARVTEKLGRAGGGLVIGEWSGGLNPGSLTGTPGEQREYIQAQLDLYDRCCAGWFFWTLKKQWAGDTGWSLRDSVAGGVFPDRVGLRKKEGIRKDDKGRRMKRDEEMVRALGKPPEVNCCPVSDGKLRGTHQILGPISREIRSLAF
ncbi:hypothetical protein H0H92_006268 [Tricholoma furcatifolium]|nr:hypothetical protein H0H92_006268 [Tricholoma furcatifolium]